MLTGVYTFAPSEPLDPAHAYLLNALPGVRIDRRGYILASLNAAGLVKRVLQQMAGAPYALHLPPEGQALAQGRVPVESATTVCEAALAGGFRSAEWAKLKPFQVDGVVQAVQSDSHSLWWSAGAGKSAAALAWALARPGPVVIVTIAAARRHLAREIAKWTTLDPFAIVPALLRRKDALSLETYAASTSRPVVIVGWEALPAWEERLRALSPTSVVFDEAQLGKQSRRAKFTLREDKTWKVTDLKNVSSSAAKLARAARRRLATTATPVHDRLIDLWAQLDLVEPGAWGGTSSKFAYRYCKGAKGTFGGIEARGMQHEDELLERLAVSVHRVPYSTSHGQLPPRRREVLFLPRQEQDDPGDWRAEFAAAAGHGREAVFEARVCEAAARKQTYLIEATLEVVANGGKVVVFTGRHKTCERLAKAMRRRLPEGVSFWWAHGESHSQRARSDMAEAYLDAPGPAVLVGTGDAFGTGIDLQTTDLGLMGYLPWNAGALLQREGRFGRHGQDRPVLIRYVVAEGTVDEHIADLVLEKLPPVEEVTGEEQVRGLGRSLQGLDNVDAVLEALAAKLDFGGVDVYTNDNEEDE